MASLSVSGFPEPSRQPSELLEEGKDKNVLLRNLFNTGQPAITSPKRPVDMEQLQPTSLSPPTSPILPVQLNMTFPGSSYEPLSQKEYEDKLELDLRDVGGSTPGSGSQIKMANRTGTRTPPPPAKTRPPTIPRRTSPSPARLGVGPASSSGSAPGSTAARSGYGSSMAMRAQTKGAPSISVVEWSAGTGAGSTSASPMGGRPLPGMSMNKGPASAPSHSAVFTPSSRTGSRASSPVPQPLPPGTISRSSSRASPHPRPRTISSSALTSASNSTSTPSTPPHSKVLISHPRSNSRHRRASPSVSMRFQPMVVGDLSASSMSTDTPTTSSSTATSATSTNTETPTSTPRRPLPDPHAPLVSSLPSQPSTSPESNSNNNTNTIKSRRPRTSLGSINDFGASTSTSASASSSSNFASSSKGLGAPSSSSASASGAASTSASASASATTAPSTTSTSTSTSTSTRPFEIIPSSWASRPVDLSISRSRPSSPPIVGGGQWKKVHQHGLSTSILPNASSYAGSGPKTNAYKRPTPVKMPRARSTSYSRTRRREGSVDGYGVSSASTARTGPGGFVTMNTKNPMNPSGMATSSIGRPRGLPVPVPPTGGRQPVQRAAYQSASGNQSQSRSGSGSTSAMQSASSTSTSTSTSVSSTSMSVSASTSRSTSASTSSASLPSSVPTDEGVPNVNANVKPKPRLQIPPHPQTQSHTQAHLNSHWHAALPLPAHPHSGSSGPPSRSTKSAGSTPMTTPVASVPLRRVGEGLDDEGDDLGGEMGEMRVRVGPPQISIQTSGIYAPGVGPGVGYGESDVCGSGGSRNEDESFPTPLMERSRMPHDRNLAHAAASASGPAQPAHPPRSHPFTEMDVEALGMVSMGVVAGTSGHPQISPTDTASIVDSPLEFVQHRGGGDDGEDDDEWGYQYGWEDGYEEGGYGWMEDFGAVEGGDEGVYGGGAGYGYGYGRNMSRSPSPIRYARRPSLGGGEGDEDSDDDVAVGVGARSRRRRRRKGYDAGEEGRVAQWEDASASASASVSTSERSEADDYDARGRTRYRASGDGNASVHVKASTTAGPTTARDPSCDVDDEVAIGGYSSEEVMEFDAGSEGGGSPDLDDEITLGMGVGKRRRTQLRAYRRSYREPPLVGASVSASGSGSAEGLLGVSREDEDLRRGRSKEVKPTAAVAMDGKVKRRTPTQQVQLQLQLKAVFASNGAGPDGEREREREREARKKKDKAEREREREREKERKRKKQQEKARIQRERDRQEIWAIFVDPKEVPAAAPTVHRPVSAPDTRASSPERKAKSNVKQGKKLGEAVSLALGGGSGSGARRSVPSTSSASASVSVASAHSSSHHSISFSNHAPLPDFPAALSKYRTLALGPAPMEYEDVLDISMKASAASRRDTMLTSTSGGGEGESGSGCSVVSKPVSVASESKVDVLVKGPSSPLTRFAYVPGTAPVTWPGRKSYDGDEDEDEQLIKEQGGGDGEKATGTGTSEEEDQDKSIQTPFMWVSRTKPSVAPAPFIPPPQQQRRVTGASSSSKDSQGRETGERREPKLAPSRIPIPTGMNIMSGVNLDRAGSISSPFASFRGGLRNKDKDKEKEKESSRKQRTISVPAPFTGNVSSGGGGVSSPAPDSTSATAPASKVQSTASSTKSKSSMDRSTQHAEPSSEPGKAVSVVQTRRLLQEDGEYVERSKKADLSDIIPKLRTLK